MQMLWILPEVLIKTLSSFPFSFGFMDRVYEDKKPIKLFLKIYCSANIACTLTGHI